MQKNTQKKDILYTGIINQNKFGLKSLKGKFIREWKNSAKLYLKNNKIPK